MRILWVKVGGLWPLNTGGRLRSFHLIKELSQRHQVTLMTTHGPADDPAGLRANLPDCDVVSIPFDIPKKDSPRFAGALMRSWFSTFPVDLWKCRVAALQDEVKKMFEAGSIDLCIADFLAAVPNVPMRKGVPVVLFEHNVEHLIWDRLAQHEPSKLRRTLLQIETAKMRRWEARACNRADVTLAVSDIDAERLRSLAPSAKISSIPTGVDTTYFTPNGGPKSDHSLVFTGSLDWFPNEDAILYFCDEILPLIRANVSDATLTIVGRNPSARLKTAVADLPGVHLAGTVDDVRPYVHAGAVFVVPLRIGGGTRLKIFEALAMGKAVVSTTIGAEGLELKDGEQFLAADSPADFAAAVTSLLHDPARRDAIGRAARVLVETNYSWPQVTRRFEASLPRPRKRVLGVMYSFPPAREVGAQTCAQVSRYLPDYGWDVTVLTVKEKHIPAGDQPLRDGFNGSVIRAGLLPHPLSFYGIAKRMLRRSNGNGHGAASAPATTEIPQTTNGLRKLILSMFLIPDRYTGWIVPAVARGLAAIRRERIDCIFSSGPWWTNHLVGLILAEITGLPFVAHFRDPWTQTEWLKPVSDLSTRIERALERRVVTKAQAVISVGATQTALVQQTYPKMRADKFVTIFNGYDGDEWEELAIPAPRDKFVITYAGSIYFKRNPFPVFYALQSLIESGEIAREDIALNMFCADGVNGISIRDVIEKCGLGECVGHIGFVGRPEILHRIAQSSLLLLLVDQAYQIPAKTYEYLRTGRPILALTSGGEVVDVLERTGGAWTVDPNDAGGIKRALLEAYRAWKSGADARTPDQEIVKRFDRRQLAGEFAQVFDRCTA